MAEFASIPFYTDAWLADTGHLSRLHRGLYMDLLVLCWRSPDCKIPNDIEWIARKLKCVDEEEIAILKLSLAEFMTVDGSQLYQKRLLKEFMYCRKVRDARSLGGKARWDKDKTGGAEYKASTSSAQAQHELNSHPTLPTISKRGNSKNGKQESKKRPGKVPVFVDTPQWEAWKQAYGSKPLPVVDIRNGGPIRRGWYFPTEFPLTEKPKP